MINWAQFQTFGRLLEEYVHAPLYIPPEGRQVLKELEASGPSGLISELERLSSLGSAWASAALAHICLRPGPRGKPDADRAIELCRSHAQQGDPYALYIYAWALLHVGRRATAIRAMQKAAISRFPPAAMDFVTFVWNGWGMKARDPHAALRLLRVASKLQHAMALTWLCRLYRSGEFGLWRQILGSIIKPVASVRYALAIRSDPFSGRVLTLSMDISPVYTR